MSARLSRRYGRVASSPIVLALPLEARFALNRLTEHRQTEFEDLPERFQRVILEAEAYYARRDADQRVAEPDPAALTLAAGER